MNWRKNTDIMHLSCICARRTFCGTYSTYVLLQADLACKKVGNLVVHDVVPWTRYVLQGTYLFGLMHHFFEWSVHHPFLVSLTVICHPADTFHVELVCASARIFVCTLIFTIVWAIVFSDCVHDCTNSPFGWSRVQTPGLACDLFCGSRVRFPDLAAWSFCGSRVRFPDPITCFRPVVSVAYVTTYHKVLKASQVQQFLEGTCSLTYLS